MSALRLSMLLLSSKQEEADMLIVSAPQSMQAQQQKVVREAHELADQRVADANRKMSQIREEHDTALKECNAANAAHTEELSKQMKLAHEEHMRAVSHDPLAFSPMVEASHESLCFMECRPYAESFTCATLVVIILTPKLW